MIILMAISLPNEDIASATDAMFLLLFIFVNLAVINLRKNRPDLDRGFKVPLFPFIPLLATVLNLCLAVFLFLYRPLGVWVCLGYLGIGIVFYYLYARKKEFAAKAEPVIHVERPVIHVDPKTFHILVPVANKNTVEQLQRFAARIARSYEADITVLNVIQVPAQLPPSEGRKYLDSARSLISRAIDVADEQEVPASSLVKVSHNIPKAIIETCEERKIDLMVLGWEGEMPARNRVFGTILDEIILNTVCDIALICRAPKEDKKVNRVLIPVSSIKYALLSLKLAEAMFPEGDPAINLFHATLSDEGASIEQKYREELQKFSDEINPERYKIIVKKALDVPHAIIEEAKEEDLIIMGAPEEGLVKRAFFGDLPALIAKELDTPIILTKKYTGHIKSWFQKFFGSRKTMLD
jgi:nucleotide-binding universal stress UspA family protein